MDVPERFADRFDSDAFVDDPPVGIGVQTDSTEEWLAWIPERLWERVLGLGRAYRLHILGLLDGQERFALNPPQIESLLDELQLLATIVDDDLLRNHLEAVRSAAARVVGDPALVGLVIETS
jgi:hypothetical protein